MTQLQEIIAFNEKFVEEKQYEPYITSKFPNKKMVVVTCMDTRLTELLPKALNIHNGDVKTIKNAGAIITQPFGNIMRSVLVALYELGASEVMVIGHHDCGMTGINPEATVGKMLDRGVSDNTVNTLKNSGLDLMRWLRGFENVHSSVENSVNIIRNHPLLPPGTPVHGLIIHPETGKLDLVTEGYDIATTNA
ncbi:carbonic anhydrase [Paenibacillus cellulosilyticus]|uniref:carbonic anhydrase n=1 Tax=Paenibacillus cellulosilyticus TaxID=375489 RepID=A0A2V2YWG4_9BACL|nr:carbonic anhydrase [Paenibacillus cellulosilyticus]PWW05445.1 carbonic anhydrase [Paenibacillus cellulosilyticus]QKS45512.1 carbonic anhydrase [Paenibacillus cellulosilyticus]